LLLGTGPDAVEQFLSPYGHNGLIAGTSGSGKSTFTTAFLERLQEAQYQYVIIDPEGDYSSLEGAVVLGLPERAPLLEEVLALGDAPEQTVAEFCVALGRLTPRLQATVLEKGEALAWRVDGQADPFVLKGREPKAERRHLLDAALLRFPGVCHPYSPFPAGLARGIVELHQARTMATQGRLLDNR
jgi:hypothetical protein